MTDLMDDRIKFTTHLISRQPETYLHSRVTAPHKCYFGGSNRCSCGKHRDPMGATGISPMATDRERLDISL